jgi:hypothetical protein
VSAVIGGGFPPVTALFLPKLPPTPGGFLRLPPLDILGHRVFQSIQLLIAVALGDNEFRHHALQLPILLGEAIKLSAHDGEGIGERRGEVVLMLYRDKLPCPGTNGGGVSRDALVCPGT